MAIKVYYLETEIIGGVMKTKGEAYIHHAHLGIEGTLRKLIQDTTPTEDTALSALALLVRAPTQEEMNTYNALPPPSTPFSVSAEIASIKARLDAGGLI